MKCSIVSEVAFPSIMKMASGGKRIKKIATDSSSFLKWKQIRAIQRKHFIKLDESDLR